jgi:hypothetical protein
MTDRTEFAQELQLRETVRRAIGVVEKKREKKNLEESKQEKELRLLIRELISEAKKIAVYDSTGKNELNVFLLNSTFRSTLETSYRKLTTSPQQRQAYVDHMIVFVNDFLDRLDSLEDDEFARDEKPDEPEEIDDGIKISVGDEEIEGKESMTELGPDDIKFAELYQPGSDLTGARAAYSSFKKSMTIIRDAYSNLDNPQDQADFRDELPRQIILYGREYETSLQAELGGGLGGPENIEATVGAGDPEPMTPSGAPALSPDVDIDAALAGEEEDDIANIELQEVIKLLNIEDIIENLL